MQANREPMQRFPRGLFFFVPLILALAPCDDAPTSTATPPPPQLPDLAALEYAYQARDPTFLGSLLSAEPGAEFVFLLGQPTSAGDSLWTRDQFLRLHQRLFHPESPLPGDPPTPPDIWLQALSIHLTALEPFEERYDLYSQDGGLDGKLDPQRWRTTDALYTTFILMQMAGETDYLVEGQSNFVLIEDLQKESTQAGAFLLYRWEEVCSTASKIPPGHLVNPKCLSQVLALYE